MVMRRHRGGGKPRTIQQAIKVEETQRGPSPGQYRRAGAEELYKTGARGGVQQEVRQRVQQEDGAEEEQEGEEEEGEGGRRKEEQTDKIREPLTEVRE